MVINRKRKIVLGVSAGVAAIAIAAMLLTSGKKQMGEGMEQVTSVTAVKAEAPSKGNISLTTELTGTVEPSDVVYVYAKAEGDVTAVMVKAGDMVAQGQILCEINTEQVESAKNTMDTSEVSLAEAKSSLSRMQILYSGGDLSDQDYEQYVNAVKTAQLKYESSKLSYEKQLEYSTIKAPIEGKIESFDVEVHDRVTQSQQLCVVAGGGEKRVSFYVTERMMENISEGNLLDVEKNGVTYQAVISEISSMVDSDKGLFKVKAELSDGNGIPTGSTVKLKLVTEHTENAMTVPVDAIYYSGGEGYVYVYNEGIVNMIKVEVGLYDSDKAEILGGLTDDDKVVSTWSANLYEGAKVELINNDSQETSQAESSQAMSE